MTDLWHQLRKEHIGGSDIACLFGEGYVSRYRLWNEKKGIIAPTNLDADERVQAGKFLEAGVIAWANHRWNMHFYQPKMYVKHPRIKGMACTPDAFSSGFDDVSSPTERIAQIKCVDNIQFREWEVSGEIITHAPLHIELQCQHEMACTGAQENWLIVCVGGNKLFRKVIQRDEDVIQIIEREVTEFWKSIEDNVPPVPDYVNDGDIIRDIRKKLNVIERVDLSDDNSLYDTIELLKKHIASRKVASDAETFIKNEIIHLYGEYGFIKCRDNFLTVKPDINGHIRVLIGTEKVTI